MRPRWLIVGLVVSVALNLFLIGAGAGAIALATRLAREGRRSPGGRCCWRPSTCRSRPGAPSARMLRGVRDQVRADAGRSRALRLQAWDDIAAPKPDAAAIKQALAQSRQIDIAVRAKVEDSIVDFAASLSPADRAALAAGFPSGTGRAGYAAASGAHPATWRPLHELLAVDGSRQPQRSFSRKGRRVVQPRPV